jgi:DNA-binding beta-propeller fold protein YncE
MMLGFAASARPVAKSVPLGDGVVYATVDHYPSEVAVNVTDSTVYTVNNGTNNVSVVNGRRCGSADTSGCASRPPYQDVGEIPSAIALDSVNHTAYVVNNTQTEHGSVSVFDTRRCSASHRSGCTHFPHLPPAVRLPFEPNAIAVDATTHTVYVDGAEKQLAVIDARSCNGHHPIGCRRAPFIAAVPAGAGAVAVNPRTNTVYVLDYFSSTLSVIDGRRCRAGATSGCGHPVATVKVGRHPWRTTVDPATGTVYVTNFGAGTVSVINGAACNGRSARGCRRRPAVVHVGREPEEIAVDGVSRLVFVTDAGDDSVSIFPRSSCDAFHRAGCGRRPATVKVGSLPNGIAVNPRTETVYVADNNSSALAVFRAALPRKR